MQLGPGISAEKIRDQWVVMSQGDNTAHHLSGPAATVIDCVLSDRPVPQDVAETVANLIDLGILEPAPGWSRRQVITTAAAAATIGVTSVALPTAALASSSSPPDPGPDPNLGITWSPVTVNNRSWYSVAHGNGVWIAVSFDTVAGSQQVMRSTDDAVSWNQTGVTQPTESRWLSIAYSQERWVAVSLDEQRIITSTDDGLTWSEIGTTDGYTVDGTNDTWTSVAPNGSGTWVAVANKSSNRNLISTNNGVTWSRGDSGADSSGNLRSVAFGIIEGAEGWVAVGNNWRLRISVNGTTWSDATTMPATPSSPRDIRSVAFGDGRWVAVGQAGRVLTSTDGANWSVQEIPGGAVFETVAFGDGIWVALASAGSPIGISSTNGTDWEPITGIDGNQWRSVAYGDGVFVAVSSNGDNRVMRSPAIAP